MKNYLTILGKFVFTWITSIQLVLIPINSSYAQSTNEPPARNVTQSLSDQIKTDSSGNVTSCPDGYEINNNRCVRTAQSQKYIDDRGQQSCEVESNRRPGETEDACFMRKAQESIEANDCNGLTGEELRNCQAEAANRTNSDLDYWTGDMGAGGAVYIVVQSLALVSATFGLIWFYANERGDNCHALSYMFMMAGGLAGVLTDIIVHFEYKDKAKNLRDEYRDLVNNEETEVGAENNGLGDRFDPTEDNQARAFEYLAAIQDSMGDAAQAKAIGHGIAGGLYAIAAVMALIELIQGGSTCFDSSDDEATDETESTEPESEAETDDSEFGDEEFDQEFEDPTIEDAPAQAEGQGGELDQDGGVEEITGSQGEGADQLGDPAGGGDAPAEGGSEASSGAGDALVQVLKSIFDPREASSRLIFSIILSGIEIAFTVHLQSIADSKHENAKRIRELKEGLKTIAGGSISSCVGKRDVAQPGNEICYCNDEQGNPIRQNHPLCQQNLPGKGKDYKYQPGGATSSGCINVRGKIDQNCTCRNIRDKTTGENACRKVVRGSFNLPGLGSIEGMNETVPAANALYSGNRSQAGTVSGSATSVNNAAKNLTLARKMMDRYNKTLKSQGKKPLNINKNTINGLRDKVVGAIVNYAKKNPGAVPSYAAFNLDGSGTGDIKESKAIEKAKKELEKNNIETSVKLGKRNKSGRDKKSKGDDFFNFGSQGGRTDTGPKVIDIMKKEYKFKKNDISKRPSTSIFKIISNRYISTGLKRLFED